jgi:ATP-dependent Clp protease ATP-binding subunit ClpA
MFRKIKQRFRDMGTIKSLCLGAEKHANANGQKEPGAEHFLLTALELPDGTARKAFERVHVDPNGFRAAIIQQYQDALRNVGIESPQHSAINDEIVPMLSSTGMYKAQPSAQALMQQLVIQRKSDPSVPLLGAHVIIAVTSAQYGVAARALRAMGIDLKNLTEAATAEIDSIRT